MSRSAGAFVVWTPSKLPEEIQSMIDRTTDFTLVMSPISRMFMEDAQRRLSSGDPSWPAKSPATIIRWGNRPVGIGEHGGFAPTIQRFYSARNAGWKTKAPHAHLFEYGTQQYSTGPRWGSRRGGRVARGTSSGRDGTVHNGSQHQPARPFAFISDPMHERANDMIASWVVGEWQERAA